MAQKLTKYILTNVFFKLLLDYTPDTFHKRHCINLSLDIANDITIFDVVVSAKISSKPKCGSV